MEIVVEYPDEQLRRQSCIGKDKLFEIVVTVQHDFDEFRHVGADIVVFDHQSFY